jgi:hypothetical protein
MTQPTLREVALDTSPARATPVSGHPLAAPRLTRLDLAVLGLFALTVAVNILSARLAMGWITSALGDILLLGYLCALAAVRPWRPLIVRLLALSLVAGLLELGTDLAGERVAHSLIYPPHEPLLLASPIYMPASWVIVLVQLGYLAWRLRGFAPRMPLWLAVLLTGAAGAITIPFYEEMAYYSGWWRYAAAPGFGHTPFYVMLFEGAIAALLPLIVRRLEARSLPYTAGAGVLVGLWMPWAALFSWLAIGR